MKARRSQSSINIDSEDQTKQISQIMLKFQTNHQIKKSQKQFYLFRKQNKQNMTKFIDYAIPNKQRSLSKMQIKKSKQKKESIQKIYNQSPSPKKITLPSKQKMLKPIFRINEEERSNNHLIFHETEEKKYLTKHNDITTTNKNKAYLNLVKNFRSRSDLTQKESMNKTLLNPLQNLFYHIEKNEDSLKSLIIRYNVKKDEQSTKSSRIKVNNTPIRLLESPKKDKNEVVSAQSLINSIEKKIMNSMQKYQQSKAKKQFNWKKSIFPLSKIQKCKVYDVLKIYLEIGDVATPQYGAYKIFLGSGNNSYLIGKIMKDRGYWVVVDKIESDTNLVWTQLPIRGENSFNRSQKNRFLTLQDKKSQNDDFGNYSEFNSQVVEFLKLKSNNFIQTCEKLLSKKKFKILIEEMFEKFKEDKAILHYLNLKKYLQFNYEYVKEDIQPTKTTVKNHCQLSYLLGNKKGLLYYLQKYQQIFQDSSQIIPSTKHFNEKQIDYYRKDENRNKLQKVIEEGPWILKPGQQTNRGSGISIHLTSSSLQSQMNIMKLNNHTSIIQKYISPLLYNNRKFDIRIWVLWSAKKWWVYREGYVRTSSKEFSIKSTNKFVHLTNDAIQSQSEDYGKFEPANKISFNELNRYIATNHPGKNFKNTIYPQIKEMIIKLSRIGGLLFSSAYKKTQFELFGLDFLIDENFKPWIIQCNTNPCLDICCSLLSRLIPNMLDNVLTIAVDPFFPTPLKKSNKMERGFWNNDAFNFQIIHDTEEDDEIRSKIGKMNMKIEVKEDQFQQIFENFQTSCFLPKINRNM